VSWTVQIGDGHPLEVSSPEAVAAAVTGILMGSGLDAHMAETYGRSAWEAIRANEELRRKSWATQPLEWRRPVGEGTSVIVRATWLPEDPNKWCNGYTSSGSRCGRHLHHRGEC
jgi:O-acetyl-ADP-ribose deacetylase (regulator of RNase III)